MTTLPSDLNSADAADYEIVLSLGDLRLKVSPYGASLRGLWRETADGRQEDIVLPYTGAKGKVGGQGDVLVPFPGRVRDGKYTFEDQAYQMEISDKEGPNAIHGFLRHILWEVLEHTETQIAFAASFDADEHPGYPFAIRATVAYSLTEGGMTCYFTVHNVGNGSAPVAAGFHPYFTVGSPLIDSNELQVPMEGILEVKDLLPTGRVLSVEGTPFDFLKPRTIGDTVFNICYMKPIRDEQGRVNLRLAEPDGRALTVWMDEAFDYVVLYSGDPLPDEHRRRSLAIEPMTCGVDAFNYKEWGLTILDSGATMTGSWGVTTG